MAHVDHRCIDLSPPRPRGMGRQDPTNTELPRAGHATRNGVPGHERKVVRHHLGAPLALHGVPVDANTADMRLRGLFRTHSTNPRGATDERRRGAVRRAGPRMEDVPQGVRQGLGAAPSRVVSGAVPSGQRRRPEWSAEWQGLGSAPSRKAYGKGGTAVPSGQRRPEWSSRVGRGASVPSRVVTTTPNAGKQSASSKTT